MSLVKVDNAKLDALRADEVRKERDAKLAATDWRVTKALESGVALAPEWADYRQALRDIPQQDGFPHDVTWPAQIPGTESEEIN